MKRRLWFRLHSQAGQIPVFVTQEDLTVDGALAEAYYDKATPCIVIKYTDNVDAMKMRLHHELLHVCFGSHSGDAVSFLGRTPSARDKREEHLISFLEPIQFDLLKRNGFLRYPNPPKLNENNKRNGISVPKKQRKL